MIELTLLAYLKGNLSCPVYMEIPSAPPKEFVILEKTGSSVENHINRATFAIQSYSDSLYNAALLNEEVKALMDLLPDLEDVSKSDLNSDYNFPDTTNKRYRYQAVYDLVY